MQLAARKMIHSLLSLSLIVTVTSSRRIIDLSHTLDENSPKIPLKDFGVEGNISWYENYQILGKEYPDREMWLELRRVELYEHQGTHIDAPSHFGRGRQQLHEIPPERLMGPGVVLDVQAQAKANPDYAVTVEDVLAYEDKYGRIPEGAIVMMNSGWSEKYPFENLVFGNTKFDDFSAFHYPGFGIEACKFLHEQRKISVLGVDTPSTDPNQVGDLDCHRYLQPLNVPLLEYVANLNSCPPNGTTMFLGAPKIRHLTGVPTRIFAVVDDATPCDDASAASSVYSSVSLGGAILFGMLIVF